MIRISDRDNGEEQYRPCVNKQGNGYLLVDSRIETNIEGTPVSVPCPVVSSATNLIIGDT